MVTTTRVELYKKGAVINSNAALLNGAVYKARSNESSLDQEFVQITGLKSEPIFGGMIYYNDLGTVLELQYPTDCNSTMAWRAIDEDINAARQKGIFVYLLGSDISLIK